MLNSRVLIIGGLIALSAMAVSTSSSRAFTLVSPDEVARERAKGDAPRLRGAAKGDMGGPQILLVTPRGMESVPSPLDIELRFIAKAPSKIVRESLRASYGFFGFDVTERLTRNAKVTASGILARNADLPAGSHSITIEIRDDRERIGRKTFQFEIREQ